MNKICIHNYIVPRFRPYPRTCQELKNMSLGQDGFIPSPKSQDKDPPFFRLSVTTYWMHSPLLSKVGPRLLPPQPEDAPWLRDWDAPNTWWGRVHEVMNKWFHKIQGILASWRNICFSREICSQELLIFISVRNLQHRVVLWWINLILTAIVVRWRRNVHLLSSFWGTVCEYSQQPPFVNCWETRRGKEQTSFYCAKTRIMEKFAVWSQLTAFTKQGFSLETNRQSATQNILAFYGSRYFTTADKTAHYWTTSWSRYIQSVISHSTTVGCTNFIKYHITNKTSNQHLSVVDLMWNIYYYTLRDILSYLLFC
jgi:hypothetical protein